MKVKVKLKKGFSDVQVEEFELIAADGEVDVDLTEKQIEALEASGAVDIKKPKKKSKKD